VTSFIDGAAPQESDHEIIDHHQPVVVGVGHTASKDRLVSNWICKRGVMVCAMKNALVAVPKGKGQCPSTMRQSGNYCIDTKPQRR
jgi:hypothetical protein